MAATEAFCVVCGSRARYGSFSLALGLALSHCQPSEPRALPRPGHPREPLAQSSPTVIAARRDAGSPETEVVAADAARVDEPRAELPAASSVPLAAAEPGSVHFGGRRPAIFYAALERGSRPLTVVLHGMCAIPEWECPVFRAGATRMGWLLCPAGPVGCGGDGGMWSGSPAQLRSELARATAALQGEQPEVDPSRKVLIGYSLGASAALAIVTSSPDEWRGLMLVNAGVQPEPALLQRSGLRRVALVAGARDGSRTKLQAATVRLSRAGLEARFFVLAETGHYFDAASEQRMVEPVTWLLDGL